VVPYPVGKSAMAVVSIDPSLVVYLSRHGETLYNRENRFNGRTDSPLTEAGIVEAQRNGRILRDRVNSGTGLRLVSSPLGRALHTSEIIGAQIGIASHSIETDPRLTEISFGEWEGLTIDEIKAGYPGEWENRHHNMWTYAPPGGESYEMVAVRAAEWLAQAQGPMIVVTHGAVDRVLRGLYAGLPSSEICALPEPQDVLFQLWEGRIATL